MALASPTASPVRIFAEADSKNTNSLYCSALFIVSIAEPAAAIATAVSLASLARLCCTAWNFEICFSKATRSWA